MSTIQIPVVAVGLETVYETLHPQSPRSLLPFWSVVTQFHESIQILVAANRVLIHQNNDIFQNTTHEIQLETRTHHPSSWWQCTGECVPSSRYPLDSVASSEYSSPDAPERTEFPTVHLQQNTHSRTFLRRTLHAL